MNAVAISAPAASGTERDGPVGNRLIDRALLPNWAVLIIVWLITSQVLKVDWAILGVQFFDTDDAMRLMQVRDLLAGQSWFDLSQHRLDPSSGVQMHWSRFIDLPLALLISAGRWIATPETAEKLAMLLWPPILFLPLLLAVRAIGCRLGGSLGGLPAMLAVAQAAGQFVPGRIDHHNVQLTLTLTLVAFAVLPPSRMAGAAVGVVTALLLAIGMEGLPFAILAGSSIALRYVFEPSARGYLQAYGIGLAASAATLLAATVSIDSWSAGTCDAFAGNYAALLAVGGLALAVAGGSGLASKTVSLRLTAMLAAAGLAAAAFIAVEPACLAGPYAQVDSRLFPQWINHIQEMQPLLSSTETNWRQKFMIGFTSLVALGAAAMLLRRPGALRDSSLLLVCACFATALAIGLMQTRGMMYADVMAAPLIGAAIGQLALQAPRFGTTAVVIVLAGALLVKAPPVLLAAAGAAAKTQNDGAATPPANPVASAPSGRTSPPEKPGFNLTSYAALAADPPGLVLAEIDMGPFILAATPHSVLAAPYHRYARGILSGETLWRTPLDEAFDLLQARGVTHVAFVSGSPQIGSYEESVPGSLGATLGAGTLPDWLERLDQSGTVKLFRLRRPKL